MSIKRPGLFQISNHESLKRPGLIIETIVLESDYFISNKTKWETSTKMEPLEAASKAAQHKKHE